ncbi:MAG: hypothetical protein KGM96_14115, partial [Acidobacteriota bacterium]|nr:hypothetical protein [Acidobacteriota bacterium]
PAPQLDLSDRPRTGDRHTGKGRVTLQYDLHPCFHTASVDSSPSVRLLWFTNADNPPIRTGFSSMPTLTLTLRQNVDRPLNGM